jgi:quercetin dioxygenase-like cupin family protein
MVAQQRGIKRTDLQQHDLSVPGREVVQARVDLGPEAPFVKHTRPGEEINYVLEGSLEYQVEGQPPTTLKAGDVLFVPAGRIDAVKNAGSGNAAELATYVVEKSRTWHRPLHRRGGRRGAGVEPAVGDRHAGSRH